LEYETIGEFLTDLKKEFGRGNDEIVELKKIE